MNFYGDSRTYFDTGSFGTEVEEGYVDAILSFSFSSLLQADGDEWWERFAVGIAMLYSSVSK